MWLGHKRFLFIFGLSSKAQSPPVTLYTTCMDDTIRLALAAKGGCLVFTREGKTAMAFANDWTYFDRKLSLNRAVVGTVAAAAVAAAWSWIPFARVPICLMVTIPMTLIVRTKLQTKLQAKEDSAILNASSDILASNNSTVSMKENAFLTNNITAVEPDETREAWLDMTISDIVDKEDEPGQEVPISSLPSLIPSIVPSLVPSNLLSVTLTVSTSLLSRRHLFSAIHINSLPSLFPSSSPSVFTFGYSI